MIDRYTKVVLTVIAVALVLLVLYQLQGETVEVDPIPTGDRRLQAPTGHAGDRKTRSQASVQLETSRRSPSRRYSRAATCA